MIREYPPDILVELRISCSPGRQNDTNGREVHGPVAEHGILLIQWPRIQVERVANEQQEQEDQPHPLPPIVLILQIKVLLFREILGEKQVTALIRIIINQIQKHALCFQIELLRVCLLYIFCEIIC